MRGFIWPRDCSQLHKWIRLAVSTGANKNGTTYHRPKALTLNPELLHGNALVWDPKQLEDCSSDLKSAGQPTAAKNRYLFLCKTTVSSRLGARIDAFDPHSIYTERRGWRMDGREH